MGAEARKRQLMVEIDQQAKQQELQLSQQYSPQVIGLQQECHHQKLILEKQANDLTLEYHQRKAQEDLMLQQYEVQRQHYDEQMRICNEMQTNVHANHMHAQQMQMGGVAGGGSYVPPPQMPAQAPQQSHASCVPPPAQTAGGSYVPPPEACAGQVLPQAPSCVVPPTQYAGTSQAYPGAEAQYAGPPTPGAVAAPTQYPAPPTQFDGASGGMGMYQQNPYQAAPTAPNMYGGAAAQGGYELPVTAYPNY